LAPVLKKVAGEIDTVFSLDLACVVDEDGSVPLQKWAADAGLWISPNGKTNVGLGKPAANVD